MRLHDHDDMNVRIFMEIDSFVTYNRMELKKDWVGYKRKTCL